MKLHPNANQLCLQITITTISISYWFSQRPVWSYDDHENQMSKFNDIIYCWLASFYLPPFLLGLPQKTLRGSMRWASGCGHGPQAADPCSGSRCSRCSEGWTKSSSDFRRWKVGWNMLNMIIVVYSSLIFTVPRVSLYSEKRAELQTTKHAASCSGRLAATCLCSRSSQARFTLKARCTGVRFASQDLLAILPSVVVSARGYETYVHRKGCTEPTKCLISQYPLCKNLYVKLTIDAQRINAHTVYIYTYVLCVCA